MEVLLGFIIFAYASFVLIGASYSSASLLSFVFFKKRLEKKFYLPIGFSIFPVFVVYLSFLKITKKPLIIQILGICFAVYGLWLFVSFIKNNKKKIFMRKNLLVWSIPLVAILALFIAKYCYLTGGINNEDDLRSVVLTGSFASNSLKPAFPFDFSIPISYSYFLFETTAFLYSTVKGVSYPSVHVLAVNILVAILFYYILFLVSSNIFMDKKRKKFFLVTLFITFYGFDGLMKYVYGGAMHIEWWNKHPQITQLSSYFNFVYQYLWTASIIILSLLFLKRFFESSNRRNWYIFTILILLSAGHGTIPFVWIAFSIPVILIIYIAKKRNKAFKNLVSCIPISIFWFAFILFPLFFTFVNREVIFHFAAPAFWFHRNASLPFLQALSLNIQTTFIEFGPFLLIGIMLSIRNLFKKKDWEYKNLFLFSLVIFVSLFLMTCTQSFYFDWFSRGVLIATILSAFFAAKFFYSLVFNKKSNLLFMLFVLFILLILPQVYTFFLENYFRTKTWIPPTAEAQRINKLYELGIVFYSRQSKYEDIFIFGQAGRALLSQTDYIPHYRNKESFLIKKLKWREYTPCSETLYGDNTPSGRYFEIKGPNFRLKQCGVDQ